MANKKISELPTATTIGAGDLFPVVQGGVTMQATPDLLPLGAAQAAAVAAGYARQLAVSNGADDTAWLNAAVAGGGRFRGAPGVTYLLSSPLYLDSNTELDVDGLTLLTGSKSNIIRNRAVTASRTASDAAYTAGSATFTSATAAFVSADVGKALRRYYGDGSWDDTTIASVTNGTTAVAASNAAQTATGAGASIGTRDANIHIRVARLTRTAGNGFPGGPDDGNGLHSIFLRRVDRFSISVGGYTSSDGKYGVSIADATSFEIDRFRIIVSASDGVHLLGHCYNFTISRVSGAPGDDLAAITTVDYTQYADVQGSTGDGSFTDCEITALGNPAATPNAVALYGDVNSVYPLRNIRVTRCVDKSLMQRSVLVKDFTSNVVVDSCPGQILYTATTATTTQSGNVVRAAHLRPTSGGPDAAVLVTNVTMPDGIVIEGATLGGTDGAATPVVIGPASTIATVLARNIRNIRNGRYLLYIYGAGTTVNQAALTDCYRDGQDYGGGRVVNVDTSATLSSLILTNVYGRRLQWAIAVSQSAAINVRANGCSFEGIQDFHADTAAVLLQASGNTWSGNGASFSAGGSLRSQGDFLCDVSTLTKTLGDSAVNTANANTGSAGGGPVVCTGTGTPGWKSLVSGNTF